MTLLNRSKLLENRKNKDDAATRESFSYKQESETLLLRHHHQQKKAVAKATA